MNINQWAWLSGSDFINAPGIYGLVNMPAPENVPGARHGHAMTVDTTNCGYIFGGFSGSSGEFLIASAPIPPQKINCQFH